MTEEGVTITTSAIKDDKFTVDDAGEVIQFSRTKGTKLRDYKNAYKVAMENDLLDMSVVEARGIFFTWQKVLMASVMGIGNYLERKKRKMMKTYVPMKKGEEMISAVADISPSKKNTKRDGDGNR